jgi:ABC-type polysaccharide/polyol phosphate export permease
MLNPLSVVIVQTQHVLLGTGPTAAEAAEGSGWLAISVVLSAALFALGLWMYLTRARRLVERI